jgi:gliding motility-associated-like protein
MSHNDTNIEELFRTGLEDFEVPVNDSMWTAISSQVAQSTVVTSSSMTALMKTTLLVGASAVVIGTGVLLNYLLDDSASSTPIATETPLEKPQNTIENTTFKPNSEYQDIVAKIADDNQANDDELLKSDEQQPKTVVKVKSTSNHEYKSVAQLFMSPPKKGVSTSTSTTSSTHSQVVSDQKELTKPASAAVTIEEVKANQLIASIIAMPVGGYAPLEVAFATQTEADVQVHWNFGDGTSSKETKPTHIYEKLGSYTVTLTLTDSKGKTYKDTRTIEVLANSAITNIPTVFTPNNDGQNDYFYITGKNIESFQLMVTDIKGNTVYTSNNIEEKWDGKNQYGKLIPPGNYALILIARGTDGRVYEHTGIVYVKY